MKIVYTWAHLFAFADRITGLPLAWSPTGGATGRPSRRIALVKALLVGWPLGTLAVVIAGSLTHMNSPFDTNYWPPVAAATAYAAIAASTLKPLGTTRYRAIAAAAPATDLAGEVTAHAEPTPARRAA